MQLLKVEDLQVTFSTFKGVVHAVNGVGFSVGEGEILGIVGESGCGKTVTSLSLLRLINDPPGKTSGSILFKGKDLLQISKREMEQIRGREISMIFQNPGTALNPVFKVGEQITRVIRLHRGVSAKKAREEAITILSLVGLPYPERIMNTYPHQLSGGMKQRIIIGIALSCNASLLIADEPTTALDVTIQAQILKLLLDLRNKLKLSIILITHDVGVAAQTCDRIIVMYGGTLVEEGSTSDVLSSPRHPYTSGLLGCLPYGVDSVRELTAIPGTLPDLVNLAPGCPFSPRCQYKMKQCNLAKPLLYNVAPGHRSACFLCEGGVSNSSGTA